MKLSMGAWSFAFGPYAANPKSLEEIALRLAKAGYDGIELSGFPPHVTPEKYSSPAARAKNCPRRPKSPQAAGFFGHGTHELH